MITHVRGIKYTLQPIINLRIFGPDKEGKIIGNIYINIQIKVSPYYWITVTSNILWLDPSAVPVPLSHRQEWGQNCL